MSSDDSSEDEDEKQRRLRISGILVTSEQVKAEEATRATEAAKPRDVASEGDGGVTGRKCSEFEKHQTRQLHALLERTFAKRLQPGVWEASASWAAAPASSLCLFASSTVSPPLHPPLRPPLSRAPPRAVWTWRPSLCPGVKPAPVHSSGAAAARGPPHRRRALRCDLLRESGRGERRAWRLGRRGWTLQLEEVHQDAAARRRGPAASAQAAAQGHGGGVPGAWRHHRSQGGAQSDLRQEAGQDGSCGDGRRLGQIRERAP